ncbi:hypothetical protein ABID12_002394 [Martelella mangrovi]|uniref:LysR family transcriptional regulator n=1 Tax=Martelella mangrovi TaxID=1397477 RepID=A0ABV2IBZ3_9HYPH
MSAVPDHSFVTHRDMMNSIFCVELVGLFSRTLLEVAP